MQWGSAGDVRDRRASRFAILAAISLLELEIIEHRFVNELLDALRLCLALAFRLRVLASRKVVRVSHVPHCGPKRWRQLLVAHCIPTYPGEHGIIFQHAHITDSLRKIRFQHLLQQLLHIA